MITRLAVVAAVTVGLAAAQQTGITGRVTDPSSAAIAGAKVITTGDDGSKFETSTNTLGIYQFPSLRAATFVVRIESPGFAPAERTIALLVGQVADLDIAPRLVALSGECISTAAPHAGKQAVQSIVGIVGEVAGLNLGVGLVDGKINDLLRLAVATFRGLMQSRFLLRTEAYFHISSESEPPRLS